MQGVKRAMSAPALRIGLLAATMMLGGCLTTPHYIANAGDGEIGDGLVAPVSYRLDEEAVYSQPQCVALLPLALTKDAEAPLSLDPIGGAAESPIDLPGQGQREAREAGPAEVYRRHFDAEAKRRLVRQMLYGFISTHRPRDVELGRVDRVTGGCPVTNPARYRLVAQELGCDWLLTGRITTFEVDYFGIYSNIRIGAELELVRASTGKVIWRGSHLAQSRDGAVPLSPVDLAVGAVKAAGNLSPDQLEAVAADLARRLVRTMPLEPDNPFLVAARRQRVYQVIARSLNLRQGPGTRYAVRRVLRGAERVSVLDTDQGGNWYRVQTSDGTVGYAARRFLRPVIESTSQTGNGRQQAG